MLLSYLLFLNEFIREISEKDISWFISSSWFSEFSQIIQNCKERRKTQNITHVIKWWIQKQNTYSRCNMVKITFQRGRFVVMGINNQFDADLDSFILYTDKNDSYKYLLVVINIYSLIMLGLSPSKKCLLYKLFKPSIK